MRRTGLRVRLVAALAGPVLFLGCRREPAEPATAAINGPFFMVGTITEAGKPWGYRLKGEPGTSYRVTDAYFSVGSATLIQRADGNVGTVADLVVGQKIRLWITGAVAESLPPQVGARLIVLE